jgi:hypothetical protein
MLKDISYSSSWKHSRYRAQDAGTTLEQLITIGGEFRVVQGRQERSFYQGRLLTRQRSRTCAEGGDMYSAADSCRAHSRLPAGFSAP